MFVTGTGRLTRSRSTTASSVLWGVRYVAAVALLAVCPCVIAEAQTFDALAGVWIVVDPVAARQGGGFPTRVAITVSASAVTITKDSYGRETYPLDGTAIRLLGERTGRATLENGALTLTFTRERTVRDGQISVVTTQERYRVNENTLTVERRTGSNRPGELPAKWANLTPVIYRK